ncbi:MAG: metallophosphatase, partial [Pedosphaera sp.]|nr:metallophosphatase [Pedosphaera sp.]
MNNQIIVGPILGFEEGGFYTVCVLLEQGSTPPVLEIRGLQQTQPFTKAAKVAEKEFWRAEFQVPVPMLGLQVAYVVQVNGTALQDLHGRVGWSFYVPGSAEQPLIAYASCNGFSSAKLARDTDKPYRLWERMKDLHQTRPFSLLLMGGDQVYADEIWESKKCPTLQRWNGLDAEEQEDAKVSARMASEIAGFYDGLYADRWKDETMSLMFASVPSIMMWDDHDIFDGWGSYPERRHSCDVFQEVFRHASRVYDVFQLRCSSRNRLSPNGCHRTLRLVFRDFHILCLDNRSERTMDQIMS